MPRTRDLVPNWLKDEVGSVGVNEEALSEAVLALRMGAGEEWNVKAIFEEVKASGRFENLTLRQIEKADGKARRMAERAKQRQELKDEEERLAAEAAELALEEEAANAEEEPHTDPSHCKLTGSGLFQACARQPAQFFLEAFDALGKRRQAGGDVIFVAIRGPTRVRARTIDHHDGTYTVQWKPWQGGKYTIAVSLYGVALPGSPFTVQVATTLPCAKHCVARGHALTNALSRSTNTFEVLFRDSLGQVAHACELDVFVEPVPLASPRVIVLPEEKEEEEEKKAPETKAERREREAREREEAAEKARVAAEAEKAAAKAAAAAAAAAKSPKQGKGANKASKESPAKSPKGAAADESAAAAAGAAGAAPGMAGDGQGLGDGDAPAKQEEEEEDDGAQDLEVRNRRIRVRIGDKPLLLRSDFSKDSNVLGRLLPGSMVTVIEERLTSDKREVRACVALDSVGVSIDAVPQTAMAAAAANMMPPHVAPTPRTPSPRKPPTPTPPAGATTPSAAATSTPTRPASEKRRSLASAMRAGLRLEGRSRLGERVSEMAKAAFGGGGGGGGGGGPLPHSSASAMNTTPTRRRPSLAQTPSAAAAAAPPAFVSPRSARINSMSMPPPFTPPAAAGLSRPVALSELDITDASAAAIAAAATLPGSARLLASARSNKSGRSSVDGLPTTGWVTLIKDGKKLVTSRLKLGPGSRRQYHGQWERRKANDKRETRKPGSLDMKRLTRELRADPSGIGFGFGGMEPGLLHAHGQLHDVHRVSYSVGLSGTYLLHVRLRAQAMPLPGSPFLLTVSPAPAHGHSSRLPHGVIRGKVGVHGADAGCETVLQTADKMGNLCVSGGAKVEMSCDHGEMETEVLDKGDGTYLLRWRSKYSGAFKTHVTIDGIDCIGSPVRVALTSSTPELSRSEMMGGGLKSAAAGEPAIIRIKFLDQYSNTAVPGPTMKFGMAFLKEKEKLTPSASCHPFEMQWEPGDTGVCELKYVATSAGACALHVWCDPNGSDERLPFPGSPFSLHVGAGRASPDVSTVDGWSKLIKEEKTLAAKSAPASSDPKALFAGDTISIRPQVFDLYGNVAALEDGSLKVEHEQPSGARSELNIQQQTRGGQTNYEIRHDVQIAGTHLVHVTIEGTQVKGSPVTFDVRPDRADPPSCRLTAPVGGPIYVNQTRACPLKSFDRFGNECVVGGMNLTTRLQLVKQGVHDQTALVPANHSIGVEDLQNGTYHINVWFAMPCMCKLVINMDKNLPSSVAELPPVTLHCVEPPADAPPEPEEAGAGGDAAASPVQPIDTSKADGDSTQRSSGRRGSVDGGGTSGRGSARLKKAAQEVIAGFGAPEERKSKDAILVAAEAFADGADNFMFDRATSAELRRQNSGKVSAGNSGGSFTPKSPKSPKSPKQGAAGSGDNSNGGAAGGAASVFGKLFDK